MLTSGDGFVAAVVVVIFREDRLLAMRRAENSEAGPGLWECVSGRIDPDEDPLVAAAREVCEETGLTVEIASWPVDSYTARRAETPMVVVCYRADWISGEVRTSEEHDAHEWLSPEDFASRTTLTRLAEAVDRATRAGYIQ
jgi:8-oxo-dGTP pyrophosphatase MutT (NUDIX family)